MTYVRLSGTYLRAPVYVRADAVLAVWPSGTSDDGGPNTLVTISGSKYGTEVRETPAQVIALCQLATNQPYPAKPVVGAEDL